MLVIFAAFKKEAADLLKTIKLKKIIKIKNTVIYDGAINNKRIIICIMGMGKSNSLSAVAHMLEINLENPVFIIQGISGALVDNLNIGDLVVYESIKNLEKFQIAKEVPGNKNYSHDDQKINLANDTVLKHSAVIHGDENILNLSYEERSADILINNNDLPDLNEAKAAFEAINRNFGSLKNKWEESAKNLKIIKASGGLVSYVVIDRTEKDVLNKIHGIEAIDMESYYIAENAINNGIPVICIRSISDSLIEPIPELIIKFKKGNLFCKLSCLIELIFSRTKTRSMIASAKNISKACSNLNYFIKKILLPYFGY